MSALAVSSTLLLLFCAQDAQALGRRLRQSVGATKPVSATLADLVNDPTGRGHLLIALGNAQEYQASYPYQFSAANYNANPTSDPGPGTPNGGNLSTDGSWKVVGNAGALAVHAVPFSNDLVLFMQRPNNLNGSGDDPYLIVNNGTQTEVAALYNTTSNTFTPYHIQQHPFCSAHTLLPNGNGIVIGGDNLNLNPPFLTEGNQAVRVFNPLTRDISVVSKLERGRWYPSVMTLSDGNLLILGGMQQEAGGWGITMQPSSMEPETVTCVPNQGGSNSDPGYDNPTFAILDTTNYSISPELTLTILLEAWPIGSYPYAVLLPSGSALIIAGSQMAALYFTTNGASTDMAVGTLPTLPVPVNYPQYGSMALLELEGPEYSTSVLLAGGSSEYCANPDTPASQTSYLIDVSPGAEHTIEEEALAYPRIMGDLVLLPDGTVFLCNGAQLGVAGGSGPNGASATIGTTTAEIYDPSQPLGSRWSSVADSGIWRMYHSWALLMPDATVMVGGSEVTAEHRVQIFTPGYLLNGLPRPSLSNVPYSLSYNTGFTFGFSGVSALDRVVLNRMVSATHGNHFDQRQVVLDCSGHSGSSAHCTTPPNSSVAPPGIYMLFGVSDGVPSYAPYVSLGVTGAPTSGFGPLPSYVENFSPAYTAD